MQGKTNTSPCQVDELVFAFRWALVSGWVKFFNWVGHHGQNTPVELLLVLKEFPLEVKADCAIKLQLETCLGQGYKCDVSTSPSPQCYPLSNFKVRTSEGGRVAVATIAKGGDHDLVATLQVTKRFLSDQFH